MAAGGGWNFVFRVPRALRQCIQRVLLAADDRSLASDFTRSIHRIPESHPECGVGSAVDFLFCTSSLLLAVFFGAALGNVVRGVPLDASGYFFEPLWTNFRLDDETGILDWYTILVGVLALLALMMHGGLWVQMKTSGEVSRRAKRVAGRARWGGVALTAIVTALTVRIQPQGEENI